VPFAVGQLLSAPRSATLVARFGYRAVMTTGLLLVAGALLGITLMQIDTPLWIVLIMFFFFGLGMGSVIAPASTVMQNTLPMHQLGAGSAVQNTVRQVGGALGVAIIGTVIATRYASQLKAVFASDPAIPSAVTGVAQQSIVATERVLGELGAAGDVTELREGAYAAFLNAAHWASGISMSIVLLAALIVATLLPRITPPQQSDFAPPVGDGQPAVPTERT
jgi:DHA2 family multidrug resistance protein-like MFS transporter